MQSSSSSQISYYMKVSLSFHVDSQEIMLSKGKGSLPPRLGDLVQAA